MNAMRPGFDIAKFLMVFGIFAIHAWILPPWLLYVCGYFVTVFFAISGYLLYSKWKRDGLSGILANTQKIARLYAIWVVIYLPFTFIHWYEHGIPLTAALREFVTSLFLTGDFHYAWHLWYLLGLIVASLMFYVFFRLRINLWFCIVLSAFLVTINYLYGMPRNGLFVGFPFMSVGMLAAHLEPLLERYRKGMWFGLTISAIAVAFRIPLAEYLLCFFLIGAFAASPDFGLSRSTLLLFRRISSLGYCSHMIFFGIMQLCCGALIPSVYVQFLVGSAVTLLFCLWLIRLEQYERLKFIQYL